MLAAAHLFAGCLVGVVVARVSGDERALPAAIFGAVLPDLIDKPLGHIILKESLDNGRIYAHSLAFLAGAIALVILAARAARSLMTPVLAGVAGVFVHQALDIMWAEQVSWYYPLFGPFLPGHYPEYFQAGILAEVLSPTEWAFGLAALFLFIMWYSPMQQMTGVLPEAWYTHLAALVTILLLVSATYTVFTSTAPHDLTTPGPEHDIGITPALLALAGVPVIWAVHQHRNRPPLQSGLRDCAGSGRN
ncbi:MAG: metal-dependent hydrolase [Methanomicrobiales archaeon]|nr:metal-dependent hydrolase [Methanomicrobiales archaeon]